ncbi:FAD binding domain-containing protein [Dethiosulfatarculus sandiegensis]|uniref:Carbon-monoxide dehydrogenase n=1 Tax=Dethiosulfatarculus sandiegensis TaxID=1429043 RepID=A0A0D2J195_9BACT|nr:FAD binding domain-containing protein [Dethiosulfatarculus sandiegensis]KIX11974.1 carbon-monoxide dehydrogenase [Dethiosulfatarculus sandiegensis]
MSIYHAPDNLAEALDILAQGDARILAGGTDLMIALRKQKQTDSPLPNILLDVTKIPELNKFELKSDTPFLGAGLTFRFLEKNREVRDTYPCLALAASSVGSVQIRQVGTLGGNVGNASPAADGTCALVALGAKARIKSAGSERDVLVEELITAPYGTSLGPDELIIGFSTDKMPPQNSQAFGKVGRRQAVAVARLNVSCVLTKDMKDPRLVLSSCFPTPRRLRMVEEFLTACTEPGSEAFARAGEMAAREFTDVCGIRASAVYKLPAIRRMVTAVLNRAWSDLEV